MMGNTQRKVYIVQGKRTPFGKFGGSLSGITPVELAVITSKALLDEVKVDPETIDQVLFANVIPSTPDTFYAGRHLALKVGLKTESIGVVTNRLCGSGIQVMLDATRLIRCHEAEAILVAGAENLSMAPHLTYGARFGTKYGPLQSDDMLLSTLSDKHTGLPMGITAENLAEEYKITREEADAFALRSHEKANKAYAEGFIQGEIVPVEMKRVNCSKDEHLREKISIEEMNKLKATFKTNGTVTAASASGIVDGACSMLIVSEDYAKKHNLKPIAEIISGEVIGVDPTKMGIGPVPAIKKLLEKNKLKLEDIDLFEINEAFASQVIACQRALGLDETKLNIWGGAVALGHPLGATGVKISLTLARQLQALNKTYGISSACIGGGQGIAVLVKKV